MKNKLAILLALLMSLSTAAAVYAEDGTGNTVSSEEGIVTEEVLGEESGTETTVTVASEAELRGVIENTLTVNTTVVLTADITGVSEHFKIPDCGDYRLTLDMGGYTMSAAEEFTKDMIVNLGNLTVTGNGTFEVGANAHGTIANEGTLAIENGKFISTALRSGAVYNVGDLTIHGGEFTGAYFALYCKGGKAVINGGTFTGNNDGQPAMDVREGADVTINNGTFSSYHAAIGIADSDSRVTIYDGTFEGTGKSMILCGNLDGFTIYGGTYSVPNNSVGGILSQIERSVVREGATLIVNGESHIIEPIPEGELLSGTAFGTKYWGEGEADADLPVSSYDKAFDGDTSTFYDAYESTIDAHVGMKFNTPTRLTKVEIVPRNSMLDAGRIFLDASDGFTDEKADNLFDGTVYSKWCSPFHNDEENSDNFVRWQTDRPIAVVGYDIYTANDTADFGERNPVSWTLYGSADGETWNVIDRQIDNDELPEANYACYYIDCMVEVLDENGNSVLDENGDPVFEPHPEYSYFELRIDNVPGDIFQLSELRLIEEGNGVGRMAGMTVQGSSDGICWTDLYVFPAEEVYYAQTYTMCADRGAIVNDYSFTQFRVVNKTQHLNVAEVKFYGVPDSTLPLYAETLPTGEHNLLDRGYTFGSDSWDGGHTYHKVFDGSIESDSYYDATDDIKTHEAEVGIVLDNPAKLTGFNVYPRENWAERMPNLTVQGSVNGSDWITLYQFDDVQNYEERWYEISEDMLASAAQEYAFTQFRVVNKSEHLNMAEIEFIGTYEHDLPSFPTEIHEPIYSYITADQFMNTAWAYYERDPENPDDDRHLDWWYFDERDEEGMTRFEREFEGREPIILIGGAGFDETVMNIQDIDNKPIIAVVPWAFAHEDGISEVIVNEWSDCKYIMNNAFAECYNIETVTVSNSLREVADSAFMHNWNLREFIKDDDDLSDEEKGQRDWAYAEVVDNVLFSRGKLVSYPAAAEYIASYHVPDFVDNIGSWAFAGAQIGRITMGNNVVYIFHGAFSDSVVDEIIVSPALCYLGNDVFMGCTDLTYLEIPSDKVEIDRWMDSDQDLTDGEFMFTTEMFERTVDEELGRSVPLKVVSYEGGMIDEYIDYIHALTDAREDYDMSHVIFEAETDTYWYGGNWFEECGENEVFLLGYSAPLDAEITTMPTETYDGKTIIGIRTDGEAWPAFCDDHRVGGSEGTFTIPEGIKYIFDAPFRSCENLRTIIIPVSMEDMSIPFAYCHNLEKFVVSEGSEYFEARDNGATLYCYEFGEYNLESFAVASGMTHVDVAEGTNCINNAAFERAKTLKTVSLPDSLFSIDWNAFKESTLETIIIPKNVDRVLPEAFMRCPNLTEVRIERMAGEFCTWEDQDFTTVFEGSDSVTVYVYEGTDAHRAAEEYGWPYETVELDTTVYDTYVDNDGVHLSKAIAKPGDTYFTIPDDVQIIDDRAFAGIEGIETVVFPANLRYIGHEAFAGCGEFEVIFKGAVPMSWEDSSFDEGMDFQRYYDDYHYCRNIFLDGILYQLTGENQEPREAVVVGYWYDAIKDGVITVPETIEGYEGTHTVVALANDAFHRDNGTNEARWFVEEVCGETLPDIWAYPTEIYLPDSIRYIGDAFGWQTEEMWSGNEYGLTHIDLPASVQFISHDFVTGCWCIESYTGLDDWNDEESNNPYRMAYGKNENGEAIGVIVNTWNEPMLHAYPQGNAATEFIMPAGIEVIQHNAFRDAQHLTHVNLTEGNSLRSIRHIAFMNCRNLERVMIPSSLDDIGGGAFRECHSLMAFDIPNGNDTFIMCEDDGTLRMDGGSTIAVVLFGHIGEDGVYRVSDDVYDIKDAAAQGFYALEELIIPAGVHNIYDWAFEDARNLRKVTIEGTLDYFSIDTFSRARNLETIVYNGDVLNMHYYRNDNIDDFYVRVQLDEDGNDVYDEDGRNIREPFEFVTTESDCHINFFLVDDYDYENGNREYLDVDNNEYFTLVRGGTVDPEPDEPDVPVEPGEPDEPTGTPDEPAVPEDAVKIIVGNGYGAAGTTVTVDISINDIPEPGISSLDLSVEYDKDLLRLVSANDTGLLGGALYSNDLSMIPYGLTWNNLENYTVSGVITTLTFEVLEMPDSGEIEVTVINNECATIEEVQVDVVVTNGIISKRLPGDVNEDGKVSQLDVTRLRKYLAGGWDVEINASNADVNGDGKISQLDVTRLRKYLVGGWNVTLE